MALPEMRMHKEMNMECIKILLAMKHERFTHQLKAALDRGWAEWAKQAAELQTYRADQENRQKGDKGFYKLNEENIAMVSEDLTRDYQALADQHSEEIAQLLEEFGDS